MLLLLQSSRTSSLSSPRIVFSLQRQQLPSSCVRDQQFGVVHHEWRTTTAYSLSSRKRSCLFSTHFESSVPNPLDHPLQQDLPSQQQQQQQDDNSHRPQTLKWSDMRMVVLHVVSCWLVALTLCAWEDYIVSFVPHNTAVPRRSHAVLGMAYGQEGFKVMPWISDQDLLAAVEPKTDDSSLTTSSATLTTTATSSTFSLSSSSTTKETIDTTWPPRPYNDIMLEHRTEHIPRWKRIVTSEAMVREATRNVYQALQAVDALGKLADDYEWDQMRTLLHAPVLRQTLEEACNTLRTATTFLSPDARRDIGFHWGSCAWRHCGAQADAQEALDELDMMLGVLEPFECQFVLDIVERSLRDVLAVVPLNLHPTVTEQPWRPIQEYQPYQSPPPPTLPDWVTESTSSSSSSS